MTLQRQAQLRIGDPFVGRKAGHQDNQHQQAGAQWAVFPPGTVVRIRGLQSCTGLIAGTLGESLSGDQSVLG